MISLLLIDRILEEGARIIAERGLDETWPWPASGRSCGDCQVCCQTLTVEGLDKPLWGRCQHQCAAGCGIYDSRPTLCKSFECLWRSGVLEDGDESYRPDRLGVMLDFAHAGAPGQMTFNVWPAFPGAEEEPRAAFWLGMLACKYLLLVHQWGTENVSLWGPQEEIRLFLGAEAPDALAEMEGVLHKSVSAG